MISRARCLGYLLLAGLGGACRPEVPPLFREVPPAESGVGFVNDVHDTDSVNLLTYPYFYNGGGVALGDLNGDGLTDIFLTANRRGGNRLYLNRGRFTFSDVTARIGLAGTADWTTGVTLTDVNADGRLDLYVCAVNLPGTFRSQNALYVNQGNAPDGTPRFAEQAAAYGLDFRGHSTQAAFFDYDHDGDLDCFLLNHAAALRDDYRPATDRAVPDSVSGSRLFRNETGVAGPKSLDLSAKHPPARPPAPVPFRDVTTAAGLYPGAAFGLGLAVGDVDGDGWDDVYVGNDFRENDFLYRNTRDGRFREAGGTLLAHHSRFSMGCDLADFTNDGLPDLLTLDMLPADERVLKASLGDDEADTEAFKRGFGYHPQVSRNCLHVNLGPGLPLSDRALQLGVAATDWSWSVLGADFDNDGYRDVFITNGIQRRPNDLDFVRFASAPAPGGSPLALLRRMPEGRVPDVLLTGGPAGSFTDRSAAFGFTRPDLSNGAATADLDNDGDLDLVVNRANAPAGLYENRTPPRSFLQFQLVGPPGNPLGLGTTVRVYAGGRCWYGQQLLTRGFQSASSPLLHVGLGALTRVDSVVLGWPDGGTQRLRPQRLNTRLTLRYRPAGAQPVPPPGTGSGWEDRTAAAGLAWQHRENDFNDFARNPLLPHRVSTQGPRLAVGDATGDGRDDVFVGGAAGQPGALFVQQPGGTFRSVQEAVFAEDAACEDVDALFFDTDGDRDLDLYVVSGGNEAVGTDPRLPDRLYRNDGRGTFAKDPAFPSLFENKSCVRAADFDRDGDLDLFVGGRVNARQYGATPTSVLLRNDGRGHFAVATNERAPGLETIGLVTDAAWTDLDRDGWPDLVVVGHWMPITVFRNHRGRLRRQEQPTLTSTRGLWNRLFVHDPDRDGYPDLLAGNWGTNAKLTASARYPLRLYLADPDQNGEVDPLLSLSRAGREYPFLGKDKLEQRLPFLKKKHLTYREIAGQTMTELFGGTLADARVLRVETLESVALRNVRGQLHPQPLPADAQAGPVFGFTALPDRREVLALGNFFGVTPYEGRYGALVPVRLRLTRSGWHAAGYLPLPGELRDAKPIRVGSQVALLVTTNDGPIRLLVPAR